MRFRARKTIRIGLPRFCIRWNFTQRGYTGWGVRVWRYTYSNRMHSHSFDTPGWGHVIWGGKKRGASR